MVLAQECKPSDYEEWSPPQPGECLLGRNYTMQVRVPRGCRPATLNRCTTACWMRPGARSTHSAQHVAGCSDGRLHLP